MVIGMVNLLIRSEASVTHAVPVLRAARGGAAVMGTVQQCVVEADVVGSALRARSFPVDGAGLSCVVNEGSCVCARTPPPQSVLAEA
jgi:hypothetical protein